MKWIKSLSFVCLLAIEHSARASTPGEEPTLPRHTTPSFKDMSDDNLKMIARQPLFNESLILADTDLEDGQLTTIICSMNRSAMVHKVDLSRTRISSQSFLSLSMLNQLVSLILRGVHIFTHELGNLVKIKSLKHLDVSECPTLGGDLTQALGSLGHLAIESLVLEGLPGECPLKLKNLSPLQAQNLFLNLKNLRLSHSTVDLNSLAGFPLESLHLRHISTVTLPRIFTYKPSIATFIFEYDLPTNRADKKDIKGLMDGRILDRMADLHKVGTNLPLLTVTRQNDYSLSSRRERLQNQSDFYRTIGYFDARTRKEALDARVNYENNTEVKIAVIEDYWGTNPTPSGSDMDWLSIFANGYALKTSHEVALSNNEDKSSSWNPFSYNEQVSVVPNNKLVRQSDTLTVLDLSENNLQNSHIVCLGALKALRKLILDDNPLDNRCLNYLQTIPLVILSVKRTQVTDNLKGVYCKPPFPQTLKKLYLDGSPITGEMLKSMHTDPYIDKEKNYLYRLEDLSLLRTPLTPVGLNAIFNFENCIKIFLDETHKKAFAQHKQVKRSYTKLMYKRVPKPKDPPKVEEEVDEDEL